MRAKTPFRVRHLALAATLTGLLTAAALPLAVAASSIHDMRAQANKEALEGWHKSIKHLPPPTDGCFHASYPSLIWHRVVCGEAPVYRSATARKFGSAAKRIDGIRSLMSEPADTAGNGADYAAQTTNTTMSAVGSFPQVAGVTSESGARGANDYTLQLNTDINSSSTACSSFGYAQCQVWEQFVYATNYGGAAGQAQVFIQNWVFPSAQDYSTSGCPAGWNDYQGSCYVNSQATNVPSADATQLASLTLSGVASSNGNDTATFTYGTDAYSASEPDTTVSLSSWWSQSEFNVVGNGGGSAATFNSGTSITVNLAVNDGTTNAPTCLANAGTTGETNNLNLGACTASQGSSGGALPSIQFTESN
ncbi:hypothetical protein [Dyella flagellata]|uniref:Secreted protein n=1 Tax=Dyella flagellata TaxID=1867833 RepID=A0ABQ5XGY5_9GAMM|nr:hypothetical protein [Dyella flagellata]GLQ89760.1 hypothetical protein GCM10007898_33350 [Dyella flagellata]